MFATYFFRPSVDLQDFPVAPNCSSVDLVLGVAVRVCKNQTDDFLVQSRPVLPRPRKPQSDSEKHGKSENGKSVVEIGPSDRKEGREAEEDHHPSGVDQSEDVDRDAISSKVPSAELDSLLDSCAEHAANRNEVGSKQPERGQ